MKTFKSPMMVLCAAALLGGSVICVRADALGVYLYLNGVPVLMTDCQIQDHQVFELGRLIGTIDVNNKIDNNAGQVIGYITSGS